MALIGEGKQLAKCRQLAAWPGLVPRQHSTGGKFNLLAISKGGDCYLRTLLIHEASAVIPAIVKLCASHGFTQKSISGNI